MAVLEIHEITFDATDPHRLASFWAALLERQVRPGDMPQDDSVLVVPKPGQPGLLFLRVPEGKTAKNRLGRLRRSRGQRVLRRPRPGRARRHAIVTGGGGPPTITWRVTSKYRG
jgi:hypothetical protein